MEDKIDKFFKFVDEYVPMIVQAFGIILLFPLVIAWLVFIGITPKFLLRKIGVGKIMRLD